MPNRRCGDPESHHSHAWESDDFGMEWCGGGPALPEVVEATTEESAIIAAQYLEKAARELRAGDYSHADVWIHDALVWLPASTH